VRHLKHQSSFVSSVSVLWPGIVPTTAALHAWTTGAMGTVTLAVMTRATLGHSGRTIAAPPVTVMIYGAIVFAVLIRIAAPVLCVAGPLLSGMYCEAFMAAGIGWMSPSAASFGPIVLRPRASTSTLGTSA